MAIIDTRDKGKSVILVNGQQVQQLLKYTRIISSIQIHYHLKVESQKHCSSN